MDKNKFTSRRGKAFSRIVGILLSVLLVMAFVFSATGCTADDIAALNERCDNLVTQYTTALDEADNLRVELESANSAITALKEQYSSILTDLTIAETKVEALTKTSDSLVTQTAQLDSDLKTANGALKAANDAIGNTNAALGVVEGNLVTANDRIDTTNDRIDTTNGRIDDAEESLAAAKLELEGLIDALDEAQAATQAQLDEVDELAAELKDDLDALTGTVGTNTANIAANAEDIAALEAALGDDETADTIKGRLAALETGLGGVISDIEGINETIGEIQEDLTAALGDIEDILERLTGIDGDIQDLKDAIEGINADIAEALEFTQGYIAVTEHAIEKAADLISLRPYAALLGDDPYVAAYAQKILTKYTVAIARAYTIEEIDRLFDEASALLANASVDAREVYIKELAEELNEEDYSTDSWNEYTGEIAAILASAKEAIDLGEKPLSFSAIDELYSTAFGLLEFWDAFIGDGTPLEGYRYNKIAQAVVAGVDGDTINIKSGSYSLDSFVVSADLSFVPYGETGVDFTFSGVNGTGITESFIEIWGGAEVSFAGISFDTASTYGIVVGNDGSLNISDSEIISGLVGIYLNPNSSVNADDVTFLSDIGLGTDTVADNITIENCEFDCSIEALGFTAPNDVFENFCDLWADILTYNESDGEIIVNAYGRFSDGFWLVKQGVTNIETALANYEADDTLFLMEDTYTIAPIMFNRSISIAAFDGADVTLKSNGAPGHFLSAKGNNDIDVNISGIEIDATGASFAIAPIDGSSEIKFTVDNCVIYGSAHGFYFAGNDSLTLRDSTILGVGVGIGGIIDLDNLIVENNVFNCSIEDIGVNVVNTSLEDFEAFKAAAIENNYVYGEDDKDIKINAYGRFSDGFWLVDGVNTTLEQALANYQAGDTIYLMDGTYTVNPFVLSKDVTIAAYGDAENVEIVSSSPAGTPGDFISILGGNVTFIGIAISGGDYRGINLWDSRNSSLTMDGCELSGFYVGIYVGQTNAININNTHFHDMVVGIGTDTTCGKLVITNSLFENLTEAIGFTRANATLGEYTDWYYDVVYNEENGNTGAFVNAYGAYWFGGAPVIP